MVAVWGQRLGTWSWKNGARWLWWLMALAVLVSFAWSLAPTGAVHRQALAHPAQGVSGAQALMRLQSLPTPAQSAISATLGSGSAVFAAQRVGRDFSLRGGGVAARFGRRGVQMRASGGSLAMTFLGLSRGGSLNGSRVESVRASGNRVAYDHVGLSEWYAAGPLGIEQGFTLARRPAGAGRPVDLALGLAGSLRVQQAGSAIRFVSRSGGVALRYGGLSATDASGRPLRVALQARGGELLVRVWDRGARYPLRIDPLIQQGAKLTGSGQVGASSFGASVALSADGNTVLVGGYNDNAHIGAAWVFTRSGSTWTQQGSKLTASDETGSGYFGWSVALSSDGNTALIGGYYDNAQIGRGVGVHALSGCLDPTGCQAHRCGRGRRRALRLQGRLVL